MELKTQDYEDAASLTTPPEVHTTAVRPAIVFKLMSDFINAGEALNKYVKKPLVYGPSRVTEEHVAAFADLADIDPPRELTVEESHFAHGAIGIATEAAEVIEALMAVWFLNQPWDRINVLEECGDLFWYQVRMLKAAGYTFPEAMEKNIAKLQNRHHRDGATFNPTGDTTRDKDAERKLLEAPAGVQEIIKAAEAPSLPATGPSLAQSMSNAKAVHSIYTAPGDRGITRLEHFEDGSEVFLESYSGGAAPEGLFGKLKLVTYLNDENHLGEDRVGHHRSYTADDLIVPPGVTLKVGEVSASAPTAEELKTVLRDKANLGLASNLELGTELEARHRLGHTEPHYRTVS